MIKSKYNFLTKKLIFIHKMTWLYRTIDFSFPIIILVLSLIFYGTEWQDRYTLLGILGGLIFVTASQIIGLYRSNHSQKLINLLQTIINAWILTWVLLIVLAFLLKDSQNFSRGVLLIWATITPFSFILYRYFLNKASKLFRTKEQNIRKVAFIGTELTEVQLNSIINESNNNLSQIIGFYDDSTTQQKLHAINHIGNLESAINDANNHKFDEVYICLPLNEEDKIKALLNKFSDTTVTVKYIPNLFMFDLMHARWTDINGTPILSVYDSPLNSLSIRIVKRIEDVILSLLILTLISPLLLIIAISVKLSSPGPVIFKQRRYGINGKEINIYKFRSMTCLDNGNDVKQATKGDTRITTVGAFLRKTSLDELPQFVNVIQGKMSIVGPRPHATAHNEEYRKLVPKYMQRHLVKPGITGWAQINGWRGETDTLEKMEKRVEFDLHYINNWSLWFDIKIILMTFIKGFINKNAY